jgi:hypothetical protein
MNVLDDLVPLIDNGGQRSYAKRRCNLRFRIKKDLLVRNGTNTANHNFMAAVMDAPSDKQSPTCFLLTLCKIFAQR